MMAREPRFDDPSPPPDDGPEEADLWFLPGPAEEEEPGLLHEAPRGAGSGGIVAEWSEAEAAAAGRLARVAARLGALDDRLRRGPEGWRQRLALTEAADLSWFAGDRVPPDRLALWIALRLAGVQEDTAVLSRLAWAVRHLTGGPSPLLGLEAFLGRHDRGPQDTGADRFADRAESWLDLMQAGAGLHQVSRACMGYTLWSLSGLGREGDRVEAAVAAARIAAEDIGGPGAGAVFAPLAMGGAGGLRASGRPADRLRRWLEGMETSALAALRHLDQVEAWDRRAQGAMARLSGRTPPALREVLAAWPMVSAPMAETLTGASRAAVQRNLAWMEAQGLVQEITGQGRFRFWRAVL